MIFQFSKKKYDDIFFSKEYHVSWLLKSSCFELSGKKKYGLLGAKKLVETLYLLITDKFWFWTFWVGKYRHFWVKKLMTERWYLLIIENFLFWTFRGWEIRSFFETKNWWKDYIYLVFLGFRAVLTLYQQVHL